MHDSWTVYLPESLGALEEADFLLVPALFALVHALEPAWLWRQVLNMKPPEILGMLEEAAGTRMYEMKKDAALRTLEKKQVKVEEINAVRARLRGTLTRVHTQRSWLQASRDVRGTARETCLHNCTPQSRTVCSVGCTSSMLCHSKSAPVLGRQVLKEEVLQACTVAGT